MQRGEIAAPLDFDDVLDDIKEECSQHGFVEAVHIMKPIDEDKDGTKKHQPVDVRQAKALAVVPVDPVLTARP